MVDSKQEEMKMSLTYESLEDLGCKPEVLIAEQVKARTDCLTMALHYLDKAQIESDFTKKARYIQRARFFVCREAEEKYYAAFDDNGYTTKNKGDSYEDQQRSEAAGRSEATTE